MQIKAITLVTLLLLVQGWCKPTNISEDFDYNGDVPADDEDDIPQSEDDGASPDTIEEPPQITSDPKSVRVRAGETVILPCRTVNADSLAVYWTKGNEFLYVDESVFTPDKDRIVRTPDNSLVIYNATVKDSSDNYTCAIITAKKSINITHKVLVEPNDGSSSKIKAIQGQDIKLVCSAHAQAVKKIKWYHQSNRLHDDQKRSMHSDTLIINKVNRHDAGYYLCLADNGMENPPYATFQVTVNYAPEIEVKHKMVHTGIGSESELTCIVYAHPRATVAWYKNHKEITKKSKISRKNVESNHTLLIMHTSEEDLGDYTCVARNELGQASMTISLTGAPSQATNYAVEAMKDDDGFILRWQLQSYSPITEYKLKYRLKGNEEWKETEPRVTDGKGIEYTVEHTIEGLQPGSYEAILIARNAFGWSPPSVPHTFVKDGSAENAAGVTTGSAVSIRPFWALSVSLLVVCAFRNL